MYSAQRICQGRPKTVYAVSRGSVHRWNCSVRCRPVALQDRTLAACSIGLIRSEERDDQEHPRTGGRSHQDQAKLSNELSPRHSQSVTPVLFKKVMTGQPSTGASGIASSGIGIKISLLHCPRRIREVTGLLAQAVRMAWLPRRAAAQATRPDVAASGPLVHRFLGTDHFGRIHMIHDGLYLGF
jgi:hypothetical protein